ncbi:MAG: hypothetical protein ACJ72J_06450 [Nitrososphaeraceae archaeon]
MEHLSSAMEQQNQILWRRYKVQELCSKGTAKERYRRCYVLRSYF